VSSLPDYFGGAFVINLKERTDRRRAAEAEFRKLGWKGVEVFPAFKFEEAAGFPFSSWRGCFHSHLGCLKAAHNSKLDSVLIFEDDIALSSRIPFFTPQIVSVLDETEWDLVYFGHAPGDIAHASRNTSGVTFVDAGSNEIHETHFYAVNKRIIPRLIEHFYRNAETVPHDGNFGPMPVDGAYNTFRRFNSDVITLVTNPKLGWQRPSRSDISPKKIDGIRLLRPILTYGRRCKSLIYRLSRY